MNKTQTYIKKEIIKLTTSPSGGCWALSIIDEMINDALEFMDNGKAKDIDRAIFKTIDQYF